MRTTVKILRQVAFVFGLLILAESVPGAAAEPLVRVRVGEHSEFHRIVFDWPAPVAYRVQRDRGQALLIFEAPASLDLSLYRRNPPAMIRNLAAVRVDGGAAARFELPVNARLKHAGWGNKVVIDVLKPAGEALVWQAEQPPATQTAKTTPPSTARAAQKATPKPASQAPSRQAPLSLEVEEPKKPAAEAKAKPAQVVEAPQPQPEPETEIRYVDKTRRYSIGPNANTLGFGAEAGYLVNNFVGLRLVGNYFPGEFNIEVDDVRYDAELDWKSVGGVVDIYPFGGEFRISGGVRYNDNTIDLDANPSRDVEIGGQTFTQSEVGTIRSDVEFNRFAPYAGLGWESRWFGGRLGLALDLGVYYQGEPSVDASANGTLANDSSFRAALDREIDELEDDLSLFSWYPVVGLSLILRF